MTFKRIQRRIATAKYEKMIRVRDEGYCTELVSGFYVLDQICIYVYSQFRSYLCSMAIYNRKYHLNVWPEMAHGRLLGPRVYSSPHIHLPT
jgi:hypothetical protein